MKKVNQEPEDRTTRDKFLDVYNIARHIHLENDTVNINGNRFRPVAYFGTLTTALNGNQINKGHPGRGKTTSAEAFASLSYGVPLPNVLEAEMRGNAEANEEKLKGTLDLGKLNAGEEVVQWNDTVMYAFNILDEVNRLTPGTQGAILHEVDRDSWKFKNSVVESPAGPYFATANQQDVGNTELPWAAESRYDVCLWVDHPGHEYQETIDEGKTEVFEKILTDQETVEDIRDLVYDEEVRKDPEGVFEEINEIARDFRKDVEDQLTELKRRNGYNYEVRLPTPEDHRRAIAQISDVDLTDRANMFLKFLDKEMNLCGFAEGERCNQQCEFKDLPAHDIVDIDGRATTSIRNYTKAAAWLEGYDEANMDHLTTIIPYALNHRVSFQNGTPRNVKSQYDTNSHLKEFGKCREIVGETKDRFEQKEEGLSEAETIQQRALNPQNFEDPLDPEEAVSELEDLAAKYDPGSDGTVRDIMRIVRNKTNELHASSDYGF